MFVNLYGSHYYFFFLNQYMKYNGIVKVYKMYYLIAFWFVAYKTKINFFLQTKIICHRIKKKIVFYSVVY